MDEDGLRDILRALLTRQGHRGRRLAAAAPARLNAAPGPEGVARCVRTIRFWDEAEEVRRPPPAPRAAQRPPAPRARSCRRSSRSWPPTRRATRVSLADLVQAMHGRAFGALLLIFAFPNALPAIPGTSGILGLPLLFLSAQMMLGRQPWLPKFISLRSMPRDDFANLVERVNPWLEWADRFTAPRLQALTSPWRSGSSAASACSCPSCSRCRCPSSTCSPALALCLIGLGVLERDGLWMTGGIAVGLVALRGRLGRHLALARRRLVRVHQRLLTDRGPLTPGPGR